MNTTGAQNYNQLKHEIDIINGTLFHGRNIMFQLTYTQKSLNRYSYTILYCYNTDCGIASREIFSGSFGETKAYLKEFKDGIQILL